MAENPAITAHRLKQAKAALTEEINIWRDKRLPTAESMYRMNDNEFMHHVHMMALTNLIKKKLDISDEAWEAMLTEEYVVQMREFRPLVEEFRTESIKAELLKGIHLNNHEPGQSS